MEPCDLLPAIERFRSQVRASCILGEDAGLDGLRCGAITFGFGPTADLRITGVVLERVANAAAAIAAVREIGVAPETAAAALAEYRGVARRFHLTQTRSGIEVIDDYAHNPVKVAAALTTARMRSPRLIAFFQPHGFAPTAFMRSELVRELAANLRDCDLLYLGEIYYAGGTVTRSISSRDLCADLHAAGRPAVYLEDRRSLAGEVKAHARPGDAVIIMGARDPSLPELASAIVEVLGGPASRDHDPGTTTA
jgi:UDP-N-acetylmuramate--alanine ligase